MYAMKKKKKHQQQQQRIKHWNKKVKEVRRVTVNSLTWQVMFVEFRKPDPNTVTFLHGRLRLSHKPSPCNL